MDHTARINSAQTSPGPDDRVFVARQPIVDHGGRVFGYELLYRGAARDTACEGPTALASARVLTSAVLSLGLDTLTGGRLAFLNFARELLVGGAGTLFQPQATVIEILENVRIDAEVVAACRDLHAKGFSLALDDFTEGSDAESLLPYAKFVKVDVLAAVPEVLTRVAQRLLPRGVRLVAEKVETVADAERLHADGYRLFQGFHFCRPTTFSGKALAPDRLTNLRLMAALARRDLTITQLETIVTRDVGLTYRVLRCVSSAAFGQTRRIQSIRQALVLLGVEHIRKWAVVWSLAGLNAGRSPEILTVALVRVRFCDSLGTALVGTDGAEHFLLGLCSLLDAILQQPMALALAEIPLSDTVRGALLGERNAARSVLDAVVAYERGAWEGATAAVRRVGLPESLLPAAYAEALEWPRALAEAAAA
jgi:c-di-GMP-related signal transduction protein